MSIKEQKYITRQLPNVKQSTIKTYEGYINKLKKQFHKPVEHITYEEFVNYIMSLENERTRFNLIVFIKNFYNVLELDKGEFKHLKAKQVKVNHTEYGKRVVTKNEYQTLINITPNPRDKAIIELLFNTGFRISELMSIKYGDIKIEENKIYISCTTSKTYTRELPIFEELIHTQNLLRIFHETKQADDYLFIGKYKGEYKQLNPKSVNAILKASCTKAKIRHIKPHDFRHAKATELSSKKIPDRTINKFMGWSENSTMLSNYNHNQLKDYEQLLQGDNEFKTVEQYKEENENLTDRVKSLEEKLSKLIEKLE